MNVVVLDASVALRAIRPDEEGHDAVVEALDALFSAGIEAVAPDVFPYEVGNSILRAGGAPAERLRSFLDCVSLARILRPSVDAFSQAILEADGLSFYDAAYVALARETGTLVWTEDKAILKAAPEDATGTASLRSRLRM